MAIENKIQGTWGEPFWDARECSIERCTDGKFTVVDHSIQGTIIVGDTLEECKEWLKSQKY